MRRLRSLAATIFVCWLLLSLNILPTFLKTSSAKEVYDTVILNGRVMDPETKLDAEQNIGISHGTIKAIPVVLTADANL